MKSSCGSALKWVAQASYAVCLAGLFLLPNQDYGWMHEFDPTMSTLPEDASGNRMVAAAALWGAALVAQGLAALLATTVWMLRFGV